MLEFLKLVRLKNIAFAAFMMYATRYFVVLPLLERDGFLLQVTEGQFSLLVVAVCCLVAAAYVINDYFDTKADRISGSRGVIVGKTVGRRPAITLHSLLNGVAVVLAFYLGWQEGCWELGLVFLAVSVLLWYYSFRYKKCFVWGNLIAALLAALIPLNVLLFELPLLYAVYPEMPAGEVGMVFHRVLAFSGFLFLNMLAYEINKDIFTVKGDWDEDTITFPVRLGIPATRGIIAGLVGVSVAVLATVYFGMFFPSGAAGVYFLVMGIFYGLYLYLLFRKPGSRGGQLNCLRLILLLGMGFSVVLFYILKHGSV